LACFLRNVLVQETGVSYHAYDLSCVPSCDLSCGHACACGHIRRGDHRGDHGSHLGLGRLDKTL